MSNFFRSGRSVSTFLAIVLAQLIVGIAVAQSLGGFPAQSLGNVSELRKLYEAQQGGAVSYSSPVDNSRQRAAMEQQQLIEARSLSERDSGQQSGPSSALEQDFNSRTGDVLHQFGYGTFGSGAGAVLNGAVSDDYLLGIGDEIILTLHGQTSKTITTRVDREGRLVVPDLRPLAAAGRRFGEVREEVEARVSNAMIGTEVFVSVGSLRMISVVVAGEVKRPGVQQVTGLSTLMDALYVAGGVRKTGSLRRIILQRSGGGQTFDAYQMLIGGLSKGAPTLQAGDRIIVPPIGETVAVTGSVKRPGIYELASRSRESLDTVLGWAGGPIRPLGNRYLLSELHASGRQAVSELSDPQRQIAQDGDVIFVQVGDGAKEGSVSLKGHVRVPGLRALSSAPTIRALIGDVAALKPEPYLLFAALITTDDVTLSRRLQPVNLQEVLSGAKDYPLKDKDQLIVLGMPDIQYLLSSDVQSLLTRRELVVKSAEIKAESGSDLGEVMTSAVRTRAPVSLCGGLKELELILASERAGRYANAVRSVRGRLEESVQYSGTCPAVYDDFPRLLPFVLEHVAVISGEVRHPGAFPIERETALNGLIAFSGGTTRDANLRNVEISRNTLTDDEQRSVVSRSRVDLKAVEAGSLRVSPGDVVRFNAVDSDRESGTVLLAGEFRNPGYYDISRGELLSQIVARAGGLTDQAYPYGAVFSRERIKRQERDNYRRAARDLQDSMLTVIIRDQGNGNEQAALASVSALAQQLNEIEPVGRVVVEADPTVLQVRPELDTLLEPGDAIYMPKRSNVVVVSGEVLNPGAMSFVPGSDASDYINLAGGIRQYGDDERVFVIQPNGTAQPLQTSAWNYDPVQIPPGSTIVVPRDAAPFDLMSFTRDIAGLVADVAITGASLATINNN